MIREKSRLGRTLAAAASLLLILALNQACEPKRLESKTANVGERDFSRSERGPRDDEAVSAKAFLEAYPVFMHARCVNCHPAGEQPLQGDDSHPHTQGVIRGLDGFGVYGMKCFACHAPTTLPGEHMPPGNPVWRLPSVRMPLIFEGRSPSELCRQLKDPAKNGGKSIEALLHHLDEDKLVLWAWDPGEGRALPPLNHEEFMTKMREWAKNGAAVPR